MLDEGREDDNAAMRSVSVLGARPDLAILPGGLTVVPDPPAEGETAQVGVVVRNLAQQAAPAAFLRVFLGNPRQGGQVLAQAPQPTQRCGSTRTRSPFGEIARAEQTSMQRVQPTMRLRSCAQMSAR